MAIRITMEGVRDLSQGECVEGELNPAELSLLASSAASGPGPNVILLTSEHPLSPTDDDLELNQAAARLVYRGDSSRTLVVRVATDMQREAGPNGMGKGVVGPELERDLQELNDDSLAAAGREIIRRVRSEHPGFLDRRPRSGRHINRPENFFALKVQPRDGSLRFAVYGQPRRFEQDPELPLFADQQSYTGFKVISEAQVDAAVRVLLKAAELKRERFAGS